MKLKNRLLMAAAFWPLLASASASILLQSCGHDGPAEKAGEKIDKAVDDVKDAVDD